PHASKTLPARPAANLHHRAVPQFLGRAARGSAALRKFACGRDRPSKSVNPYKANGTRTNLRRASGTISLTGTVIRHGSPEDTFLGDTDPRSRPMLEPSRADRHVAQVNVPASRWPATVAQSAAGREAQAR